MWATMLRLKLQVCIIRWSNQKMKVVTDFRESYNSPGQYSRVISFSSWEPPGDLNMRTRRLWGTPGTQDLKSQNSGLPAVISDFFTTFLVAGTCFYPGVNDCKFRLFKAFKRESSNLLLIRKWPEVLKSRTFKSCVPTASWFSCSGPQDSGDQLELYLKTEIYQPNTNFPPIIHIRFLYLIKCFIRQVQGPLSIFWIGEASLRVPRVQREPKVRAYIARVWGHGIYKAFEITGNAFISTNP